METLKKLDKINYLYDIYGELLSARQREVMEMYYHDDYSLGEIAVYYDISRQAVHDMLRRSVDYLEELENRLALQRGYIYRRERLKEALDITSHFQCRGSAEEEEICRLRELLYELYRENEGT